MRSRIWCLVSLLQGGMAWAFRCMACFILGRLIRNGNSCVRTSLKSHVAGMAGASANLGVAPQGLRVVRYWMSLHFAVVGFGCAHQHRLDCCSVSIMSTVDLGYDAEQYLGTGFGYKFWLVRAEKDPVYGVLSQLKLRALPAINEREPLVVLMVRAETPRGYIGWFGRIRKDASECCGQLGATLAPISREGEVFFGANHLPDAKYLVAVVRERDALLTIRGLLDEELELPFEDFEDLDGQSDSGGLKQL